MLKLALIAALAAGAAFLSPAYTVNQFAHALENEDAQAVDRYVDFDAVRTGMQADMAERAGGTANGVAAALGSLAGAAMGSVVTPDTMVAVLKDKTRRDGLGITPSLREAAQRGQWVGLDRYVVHNAQGKPTALLTRKGITWEVTGINL